MRSLKEAVRVLLQVHNGAKTRLNSLKANTRSYLSFPLLSFQAQKKSDVLNLMEPDMMAFLGAKTYLKIIVLVSNDTLLLGKTLDQSLRHLF